MRSRQLSVFFVVLASLAALVSHVGWWTRSTVLDEDGFAEALVEAMDDPELRASVSTVIVEDVVEGAEPRLVAARPVVEGAVDTVLSSDAFASALRAAARDVHRSVFDASAPTVTVQITRLVSQAQDLVRSVDPELAEAPGWDTAAELPLATEDFVDTARAGDDVSQWLTYSSTALAVLLAGLALWVSDARRRTLADIGAGMLGVAGLTIVLSVIGGIELERRIPGDYAEVGSQLFSAFTASLRTASLWLGAIGLFLIAGTAARNPDHPPPSLLTPVQLAREAVENHQLRQHPLIRSSALALVGIAIVYWREELVPLLLIGAGAWIAFVGVYGILDVVGRYEGQDKKLLVSPRALWVSAIVVIAAALVLAFLASRNAFDGVLSPEPDSCNGHVELCDKTLDEVTFAGTHNSMAAARESGWYSPYHLGGIRQQLDDGIRALLIDTHFGQPGPGGTIFSANPDESGEEGIGSRETERAESIRRQFPQSESDREPYLCHAFCELGATPLDQALADVEGFLSDNEREVLILFVEDNVPAETFADVASSAGLTEYVYDHQPGEAFPTLGEMIDSGERLLVMGETQGPPPSWYENGFELTKDTPYDAATIDELSCEVNRGPEDAPLFLVNHWVQQTPPSRDLAARANSYDVLSRQMSECEAQRGQKPNIVAVDFYSEGDTFAVVDELNGVGSGLPS
jgi:hypothetical protein